jgi:hypothetical protein
MKEALIQQVNEEFLLALCEHIFKPVDLDEFISA